MASLLLAARELWHSGGILTVRRGDSHHLKPGRLFGLRFVAPALIPSHVDTHSIQPASMPKTSRFPVAWESRQGQMPKTSDAALHKPEHCDHRTGRQALPITNRLRVLFKARQNQKSFSMQLAPVPPDYDNLH